jgi:putative AlgH/UPF0301 family transcriptional regulator
LKRVSPTIVQFCPDRSQRLTSYQVAFWAALHEKHSEQPHSVACRLALQSGPVRSNSGGLLHVCAASGDAKRKKQTAQVAPTITLRVSVFIGPGAKQVRGQRPDRCLFGYSGSHRGRTVYFTHDARTRVPDAP